MMKHSVVVFGDLPIATKIVMFLQQLADIDIVAVIGNLAPNNNDPWPEVPLLYDYCMENGIRLISLDELEQIPDGTLTLGVSCRFSKILSKSVISKFKMGIVNCHGGLNPEFQGVYSANHTFLQNSPIGGGTIHYMDAGIDTGEIIRRCEFPIMPGDTAYSVFQKTQKVLEENLEEIIPQALERKIDTVSLDELIKEGHKRAYYSKRSLDGQREINFQKMQPDEIDRRIRAFDFPGYEPAYYINERGEKVYVRYHY